MLHVKEAEGNSHAVILIKNGNQAHSEHMNKGRRGNQLLKAQSLQISQYNTIQGRSQKFRQGGAGLRAQGAQAKY